MPADVLLARGIHGLVFTDVFTVVFLHEAGSESVGDKKSVAYLVVGDGDRARGFGIVKPGFVAFGEQDFSAVVSGRLADCDRVEVRIARDLAGIDDVFPDARHLAIADFADGDAYAK